MSYYLGCKFGRDEDSTLHFALRKHIEYMEEVYHSMFGSKPKQIFMLPLEKVYYPDFDTSHYLDHEGVQKSQSLVGSMKWAV